MYRHWIPVHIPTIPITFLIVYLYRPLVFFFIPSLLILYSAFTLQVTHELLDKVGEVEANLQSHAQFQDRMDRLTDWVVVTHQTIMTRGLNPVQAQVDHTQNT